MREEPRIHSHITGRLPDGHLLATSDILCDGCEHMLHNYHNECWATWVETGIGNYCMSCFYKKWHRGLDEDDDYMPDYSLPVRTKEKNQNEHK